MIKETYVSVEVAKLLKEKGFDTPVNYEYHYILKVPHFHRKKHNFNGIEYSNCSSKWYSAPTQQMVMRWLREVHKILITIVPQEVNVGVDRMCYAIYRITEDLYQPLYNGKIDNLVDSYEEVVEAALKYCLEKLI